MFKNIYGIKFKESSNKIRHFSMNHKSIAQNNIRIVEVKRELKFMKLEGCFEIMQPKRKFVNQKTNQQKTHTGIQREKQTIEKRNQRQI